MTSPIILDDEPFALIVPSAANLPTADIPAPEWIALSGRVLVVENRTLADLPDVDMDDIEDGYVLAWDATAEKMVAVAVSEPVAGYATTQDASQVVATISGIYAGTGLVGRASTDPGKPNAYVLEANLGTSANTVAVGNHQHTQPVHPPMTFGATGSLSTGTRTLVNSTLTGLDPAKRYTITATLRGDLRGEGAGASYSVPRIQIGGSTATRERVRTVSGVDREYTIEHPGNVADGVTSVAIVATIQYDEGDPINVGAGRVTFNIKAWS